MSKDNPRAPSSGKISHCRPIPEPLSGSDVFCFHQQGRPAICIWALARKSILSLIAPGTVLCTVERKLHSYSMDALNFVNFFKI